MLRWDQGQKEETLKELGGNMIVWRGLWDIGALKKPLEAKTRLGQDLVGSICHFLAAPHPFFLSKHTQISFWESPSLPLHAGNGMEMP